MRKQADKSAGHLALQLAWTLHKRQQDKAPTLTTIIQHSTGSPRHSYQARKRNKRPLTWKRRCEIASIHSWHDAICRKSQRIHTQKNYCSLKKQIQQILGKINTHTSVVFLQTSNKWSEEEIETTPPFVDTSSTCVDGHQKPFEVETSVIDGLWPGHQHLVSRAYEHISYYN